MIIWKKLSSAKWEDAWMERLAGFNRRLAIFALPGARTIRIEVYALTSKEAKELRNRFGGETRKIQRPDFVHAQRAPQPPLLIRDQLAVVRTARQRSEIAARFPDRAVLAIPAAMAFGTGEHATTSTCLRMLCDLTKERGKKTWEMLDLGTGSGILAIAALALGAKRADAVDFDPACVRTAKENAKVNNANRLKIARLDVLEWKPARQWDVITANLFCDVLIKSASKLKRALARNGILILSGILRTQEQETLRAFRGLRLDRVVRKGKWVTAFLRVGT